MKRNVINVKLHSDMHTVTKPNTYIEIRKDEIKRVTMGATFGRDNDIKYQFYYFTFMMKDGDRIYVDIKEAYKFYDLIVKYHIEKEYKQCKDKNIITKFNEEIEK